MPPPVSIAALRSLVAAWTPAPPAPGGGIATGVPAVDAALGGGLPRGRITELVSPRPGCGGELVLATLLARTRAARQRVALVDAADGFDPAAHRADALRHLVWVRAPSPAGALACADVLVRDGNYAVVVLDLRGVPARELSRQPAPVWHRLRLAAQPNPGAILVQSAAGCVPAVAWRLVLRTPAALPGLRRPQAERAAALTVEVERGHADARGEQTG